MFFRSTFAALFLVLAANLAIAVRAPAHAQAAASAQYFVAELVGRAGMVIRDGDLSPLGRRERFRALIEQRFDVPEIARYVLGRHWQAASTDDRQAFTAAFADYLVAIYAPRIAAYGDPAFTVLGQKVDYLSGAGTVIVSSSVAPREGGTATAIEWRAERVADVYKITDVIIGGVSLMQTKRAEIGSVVNYSDGQLDRLLVGATTLIRCG